MNRNENNIAEEKVSEILNTYFKKRGSIILDHYPIFDKSKNLRYEPDNLIIDSKLGIINIEVKGLRIDNIDYIDGHNWMLKDFYVEKNQPYKQAEKQIDSFVKLLRKNDLIQDDVSKRIMIALPYITRDEWVAKKLDTICLPIILFKDDFQSGAWTTKINKEILHYSSPSITKNDFNSLKFYFRTTTESASPEVKSDPFSCLMIFKQKCDFFEHKEKIENKLKSGIKCYLIINKEHAEKLESYFNPDYEKSGLLNIHICTEEIEKTRFIEDGEGIDNNLYKFLEKIKEFNFKQYEAIHYNYNFNIAINASAGTGKTYLLVDRLLFLLISKSIDLENISIITFTNAATDEMKDKIRERLMDLIKVTSSSKFIDYLENFNKIRISTIHSYLKNVIVEFADNLGLSRSIKISSMKNEKREIIVDLLDEFMRSNSTYKKEDLQEYKLYEIVDFVIEIMEEIESKALSKKEVHQINWSDEKNILGDIFKYIIPRLDAKLDKVKRLENRLEINDIIRLLTEINKFYSNTDVRQYLFVDEFQDSDIGQIEFLKKLVLQLNYRLFVIGDVKQSIYRFRGADHTAYEQLEILPELESLSLIRNYRSSIKLIDKQNKIFTALSRLGYLKYNSTDIVFGLKQYDAKVEIMNIIKAPKNEIENRTVDIIKEITSAAPKDEIAILVRSNRDILAVKKWLKNTTYIIKENLDGNFFNQEAILDFRCLLNGLLFHTDISCLYNLYTSSYFAYDFNNMKLFNIDGDKEKIYEYINSITDRCIDKYVKLLRTEPILTVVNRIINDKGLYNNLYTKFIDENPKVDDALAKYKVKVYADNLHHIFNLIIESFDTEINSIHKILDWLNIKIRSDEKENIIHEEEGYYDLQLMTVHKAKGLQFDYVILPIMYNSYSYREKDVIIDLNTKRLEWKMDRNNESSGYSDLFREDLNQVEKEEARLLYVAMTRAKKSISIILPEKIKEETWASIFKSVEGQ